LHSCSSWDTIVIPDVTATFCGETVMVDGQIPVSTFQPALEAKAQAELVQGHGFVGV